MKKVFRENRSQIFRFIVSGIIASSINFLVYSLSYILLKNIIFASIFGYFIGLMISFIFAKIWVFRNKSNKRIVKSFSIFCLIYLLGGIEMTYINIFVNQLFNNYQLAWFCGALIGASNNYLGSKYFLFKN